MLKLKHKLLLVIACLAFALPAFGGIASADPNKECPDGTIISTAQGSKETCDDHQLLEPGCYVDSSNVRNECDPKKVDHFDPNLCYRAPDASKGLVQYEQIPCGGTGGQTAVCNTTPGTTKNCITQPDSTALAKCAGQENTGCGLFGYINDAIKLLSGLIGVVVTGMIIVGGIRYSAAGADPNAVEKAKKMIFNAIFMLIGYGVLFGVAQWLIPGGIL